MPLDFANVLCVYFAGFLELWQDWFQLTVHTSAPGLDSISTKLLKQLFSLKLMVTGVCARTGHALEEMKSAYHFTSLSGNDVYIKNNFWVVFEG